MKQTGGNASRQEIRESSNALDLVLARTMYSRILNQMQSMSQQLWNASAERMAVMDPRGYEGMWKPFQVYFSKAHVSKLKDIPLMVK